MPAFFLSAAVWTATAVKAVRENHGYNHLPQVSGGVGKRPERRGGNSLPMKPHRLEQLAHVTGDPMPGAWISSARAAGELRKRFARMRGKFS